MVRKRGSAGMACNSLLTAKRFSPEPKRSPLSAATAITRKAVRLSGAVKVTCAVPSAAVTRAGFQYAVAMKRERTRPPSAPPASPPSPSSSLLCDGSRAVAMRFQVVDEFTPKPQGR